MTSKSNLTIHQLRVFDAIVRSGSITQAALALNLPQPSVSRLISRLEREIGVPMFDRFSTGMALTTAGVHFHENAVNAIHFHDRAIDDARASTGLLIGNISIAAPDSVGGVLFAPLVQGMRDDHDGVRLRTIVSQSTEIPRMLAAGSIDIGIVADTHPTPAQAAFALFREDLYLIGLKSAKLLQQSEVSLAETAGIPLVLNALPGGFRSLIDHGFASLDITPNVQIEIDANNAMLELLAQGAGFSILPYSIITQLRARESLAAVRIVNPNLTRTLSMITATNKPMTAVMRETVRRIQLVIREKAAQAHWRPVRDQTRVD
ncbi:MAG: LysR family transcriptional regulator [Pseudomonadota bacterium]